MRRLTLLGLAVIAVAGCSAGHRTASGGAGAIAVKAGGSSCELATATVPAGRHTFEVTNTATEVTEVYIYAPGDRIVGEVENVGPSTKRNLIVDLAAGSYQVACKPGMVGNGIRQSLAVTGVSASTGTADQTLTTAVASYRSYVESESNALVAATASLVQAIGSGSLVQAQVAYPPARLHYERIEPIAESFGELDPLIDMRADDVTTGAKFVGFHAIEQQLYQLRSLTGAAALAGPLSADVTKLDELVKSVSITPLTMANGAKSLLDEVAKSKVTGEEERYSRIDLLDFVGNVEGAKHVVSSLRPALVRRDSQLVTTLESRFAALTSLLATHQSKAGQRGSINGSPYVSYDDLTAAEVKQLAVAVDAVSEPLGKLSGIVTSR